MVLHVIKWDIHPDKMDAYNTWVKTAVSALLAVPGIVEFRGYRPATGNNHIVITCEFEDFATWAAWYAHAEIQRLTNERRAFVINEVSELWGPSPVVPAPIRPGK